ncbi:Tigger transposable element-derived protein 4 [Araneus ventricosus]|uniref:Tigger transposable element-derived protein 4 n=1 Tax=Araneus ventricosus TaxID=182803 RepID=A0A4Y2Q7B0_ARAVE|nr:Tigger transposable element-derived protein 4 [Araneus ventricosus]
MRSGHEVAPSPTYLHEQLSYSSPSNDSNVIPDSSAKQSRNYVPPIVIDEPLDATALLKEFTEKCESKIIGKLLPGSNLKVFPETAEHHRKFQRLITEEKLKSCTFELPEQQQLKIVISGLPANFKVEEITEEPKNLGLKPTLVIPMRHSLPTIIKNRDKIQNYDSSNSCPKHLNTCVFEDVDEVVLKWIHTLRDKNVPISGPFIIEKFLQFAKALGYDEFRGSNGWLEKFKKEHGIMAKEISGESKDVDDNDSENWITETLSKILKDYKPENTFNADETTLFFQCLPQKTFTFKKEKCFGGKQSNARLTVMLGVNVTGHQKLKPLVIGRSKNPRCFKGAKSLEVDYDFNKKISDDVRNL